MEASIAMMQASGNQLVETIDGPHGKLYRIDVPRVSRSRHQPGVGSHRGARAHRRARLPRHRVRGQRLVPEAGLQPVLQADQPQRRRLGRGRTRSSVPAQPGRS